MMSWILGSPLGPDFSNTIMVSPCDHGYYHFIIARWRHGKHELLYAFPA